MTQKINKKTQKIYKKKKIRRKTKKRYLLTEVSKLLPDVIEETKSREIDKKINSDLIRILQYPISKEGIELSKNDFYTYINESWIKNISTNEDSIKYLIKIDDFTVKQYKTYIKLNELIQQYIKKHNNKISIEMNNYYLSALSLNSELSSLNFLKNTIQYIDKLRKDKNNLWELLAYINKHEITNVFCPINWNFLPDRMNSKEYISYIDPMIFNIIDISSINEKQNSINYVKKVFNTCLPHDKLINYNDLFDIGETILGFYEKYKDGKIKYDNNKYYNKITSIDALEKYNFNWSEYCKYLGYKENNIPKSFVVTDLNYFKNCIEELINNWNNTKWRTYWIWIFAELVIKATKKWHTIYFNFHGKKIRGLLQSVTEKNNLIQTSPSLLAYAFNPLLNNLYIDDCYDEKLIIYTKELSINLKQIFINKIKRNNWLEENTKKYAVFKLENINFEIGTNKYDTDYSKNLALLNYNSNEFLENILKVSEWRHKTYIDGNIELIKTFVQCDFMTYPYKITNMQSYIVNAQFLFNENLIKISTAYLQKPFINIKEHGLEYNLAYIGFTIAHELCHSLDNIGSEYDVNGNMNKWWGKKDKIKFETIQKEIEKQNRKIASYDNFTFDTYFTVGENIADISGLHLCEEYIRDYCIRTNATDFLTYLRFTLFYVYFAYQMKQKISQQSIMYEINTDVHSIAKYRTNLALSSSKFFEKLHNIKKGDKMYWKNKSFFIW